MVRTWAEKEMRNLKRLASVGIACPVPHLLKSHVLVMDFLGVKGWCAPRLKDASLTQEQSMECYISIVIDMRRMYHECNLVHGDLSEYNVLWHEEKPVIIDVSQSVEQAHPFSSEFLRKDITNITDFFAKKNLNILTKTELFEFIIDKYLLVDNNLNSHNNNSIIPVEVIKEKLVSLLYKKFYDIDKLIVIVMLYFNKIMTTTTITTTIISLIIIMIINYQKVFSVLITSLIIITKIITILITKIIIKITVMTTTTTTATMMPKTKQMSMKQFFCKLSYQLHSTTFRIHIKKWNEL
jgi:hypothetical protein